MIEICALKKAYGDLTVLNGISLNIKQGEIFGLAGRSGAGKSTLLRCINGLEKYNSGSLKVENTEVNSLSASEIRLFRKNVGMVFQQFSLITRAKVYDNVALPMRIWKCDKSAIDRRVSELLNVVEIPEKINSKARELSGGQKQRVAIARALAMNPEVLLCDEATSALDPKSTLGILSLLNDINRKFNITILMVTHEMDVIKGLCDNMAILENGVVAASGSVEDMFIKPPHALHNLLGVKNMEFPAEGHLLSLFYDRSSKEATLLTRMARELDIDFKILGNETLALRDKTIESITIHANTSEYTKMCKYMDMHGIQYRDMTREKMA